MFSYFFVEVFSNAIQVVTSMTVQHIPSFFMLSENPLNLHPQTS